MYLFSSNKLSVNLITIGLKIYLFLNSLQWQLAYKKCCALGLKFLSAEKIFEYDTLMKALKGNKNNN